MTRIKGFHLSTFILALSFGGVVMVSALFALSNYISTQEFIDHEIEQSFDYRHSILSLSLKERMNRTQSGLSALSSSLPLVQAMQQQDRQTAEEVLFALLQDEDTKNLDVLMVTGEGGHILGDVSSPLSPVGIYKSDIIVKAMGAFDRWTLLELGKEGETSLALLLSVPLIEPELGRVIGAVHGAFSLSNNVRLAQELKEVANLSELLLTFDGKVLVNASGQDYPGLLDRLASSGRPFIHVGTDVAARIDTNLKNQAGLPLEIVTIVPGKASQGLSEHYRESGLLLLLAAGITALAVAYMVRRLISINSRQLTGYVERVRQGDKNARFEQGGVREFNRLGSVISDMVVTIQENERYLTNLIELANSPIIAWDGEGRVTKFNKAAERVLGRSGQDTTGLHIGVVMGAVEALFDGKPSVLERSLRGSVIDNWEMVVTNPKNGEDHFMSWSISPVAFHGDGSVAAVLAQGQDITRRKLAEEELQRVNDELELRVMHRTRTMEEEISERRQIERELRTSEERFRDIAESASDWFWEMGPDLRFTYMSDKAIAATGFTQSDIIGKTRLELVAKRELEENGQKWRDHDALLRRHEPFQAFEYKIVNHEGEERVFRISGKPIFDNKTGEFVGYRGAGRDVTYNYLQQEELRRAKVVAENASQAKSDFLSSMSHELRTPLNGILGFAQLLLMPNVSNLTDKQKEFAHQIMKAGQHLLDLINEILDLSKIEARKVDISMEAIDPAAVMEDVLQMLNSLAESHQVKIENAIVAGKHPRVLADYTRLKQILANLGSNAIKYNIPQGWVRFDCEICVDENMVEFSVTDAGRGIPEEEVEELFLPFNRLGAEASDVEGTGIGLTITQQLVVLMNGTIGVESKVGRGSRFWVRLPTCEDENKDISQTLAASLMVDALSEAAIEEEIRLLYVEDNPNNRLLMEEVIAGVPNVHMDSVVSAEEGLDYLKTKTPDLIFLDINLPGMDGWQMMEILRTSDHTKSIPVVALTAQAMLQDVERGERAGFKAYLSKPINITEVFDVIRLHGRKPEE